MKTKRNLYAGVAACALMGLGPWSHASAQQVTLEPPPALAIDKNHIDLMSMQYENSGFSIATAGISRAPNTGSGVYYDDLTGVIFADGSVSYGGYVSGPVTANGATVTVSGNLETVTESDGTVSVYNTSMNSQGANGHPGVAAMLVQRTKPDGEVLNYYYQTATHVLSSSLTVNMYRLNGVTSSLGWTVKYDLTQTTSATGNTWTTNKVYIVNSSLDWCNPDSPSACTSSNSSSWPTTGGVSEPTVTANGISYPSGAVMGFSTSTVNGSITSGTYTAGSSSWKYAVTANGSVSTTTVTNPDNSTHVVTYNTSSQLLTDQDELGRVTTYTYYTTTGSGAYAGSVYQVISPDATWS